MLVYIYAAVYITIIQDVSSVPLCVDVNGYMYVLFFVITYDDLSLTKFFYALSYFVSLCLSVFVSLMKFSLSNSKLRLRSST